MYVCLCPTVYHNQSPLETGARSSVTALLCSGFGCFCALAENLKIKWSFLAPPRIGLETVSPSPPLICPTGHPWVCFLCSIHSIMSCKANVYSSASQAELGTARELSGWFWLQGLLSPSTCRPALPGTSFSSESSIFAPMEAQSLDMSQGRAPKSYFLPPQGSLWGSKQQAGQHS